MRPPASPTTCTALSSGPPRVERLRDRYVPRCGAGCAVLCQAVIHKCDDLVQRVGLQTLLAGDPMDQAIDPLDMLGAAKKRPRRGRGLGKTFGRFGVLLERNENFASGRAQARLKP